MASEREREKRRRNLKCYSKDKLNNFEEAKLINKLNLTGALCHFFCVCLGVFPVYFLFF